MQRYFIFSLVAFLAAVLAGGCISAEQTFTRVAPGTWRGVLQLEKYNVPVRKKDTVFVLPENFQEGDLPFNFEVKYVDNDRFYVEISNGQERIRCDSIAYGRNVRTARDTMNIYFPEYSSYIHVDVRGRNMQGEWVVTTKDNYRIPFVALAGQGFRFTPMTEKPAADLSGEWAALFGVELEAGKQEKAIAEFRQQGNHLEGTFRTESGDYRYLEGTVQGRKFWLSCFDGTHAYLFSGSIQGDSLQGEFRSGKHYQALWTAWRDPHFKLANPDSLTTVKAGAAPISFALKNTQGSEVKFPGPAFEGKVKIFTIMGTWCPNCRDEHVFLKEYLKNHPEAAAELSIVGFGFERNKEPDQALALLAEYKKRMGIPFDLLYAGKANTQEAERVFPALSKVSAFPTMIILDKNNRVRRIHTGFDGPATSKYAAFQQEFSELIDQLRKE